MIRDCVYPASQEIWSSSVNIVNLIYSLERVQVGAFHRDASADARTNRGAEQNLWSISQSKYCQPGLHNKQRDLRKVSQSFKNILNNFTKIFPEKLLPVNIFLSSPSMLVFQWSLGMRTTLLLKKWRRRYSENIELTKCFNYSRHCLVYLHLHHTIYYSVYLKGSQISLGNSV